ncbi:unnamed protein product [Discosporangium mesarthrocarpum]
MPMAPRAGGIDVRPMEPVFSFISLSQNRGGEGPVNHPPSYGTLASDVDERQAGVVRATQAYLWSQTQGAAGGGLGMRGDGTQAVVEGQGGARNMGGEGAPVGGRRPAMFPSQTQTRMLAPRRTGMTQNAMGPPAPRPPGSSGQTLRMSRPSQMGMGSQEGGVGHRFRKTLSGSVSTLTPGESHGLQKRRAAKLERAKAARARRSVIYRKYRDGELPDIQINLGDILRPLQHLAMLDGPVAREVFVRIFQAIYAGFDGSVASSSNIRESGSKARRNSKGFLVGRDSTRRRMLGCLHTPITTIAFTSTCGKIQFDARCFSNCETVLPFPPAFPITSPSSLSCQHSASCMRHCGRFVTPLGYSLWTNTAYFRNVYILCDANDPNSHGLRYDVVACLHAACRVTAQSHVPAATQLERIAQTPETSFNVASGQRAGVKGKDKSSKEDVGRTRETRGKVTEGGPSQGGSVSLPPSLVADTSISSLNLHSGILLLEEALVRSKVRTLAAAKTSYANPRGRGRAQTTAGGVEAERVESEADQDHWLQLSRLYATLGERDVLVGLSARASRLERTREALEEELTGDYAAALGVYSDLARKYDTRFEPESAESPPGWGDDGTGQGASAAELETWDLRQLECMRQLGRWKDLKQSVLIMAADCEALPARAEGDNSLPTIEIDRGDPREMLWTNPVHRDKIMPYYVWSLVQDEERDGSELVSFLEMSTAQDAPPVRLDPRDVSATTTRLGWLEQNMPGELARAWLIKGDFGRAHKCVSLCYDRFLERWSGLHPCANAARGEQLRGLQIVVEVEDFLSFRDSWEASVANEMRGVQRNYSTHGELTVTCKGKGSTHAVMKGPRQNCVRGLLGRWAGQLPSVTLDPIVAWDAVIVHRRDCFGVIQDEVLENASDDEKVGCQGDMLRHRGALSLAGAGAAISQGVLDMAEKFILSYTRVKRTMRKVEGQKEDGVRSRAGEGGGQYNDDWDLPLAMRTVEYNKAFLDSIRLKGARSTQDATALRAKKISSTLRVLRGCLEREDLKASGVVGVWSADHRDGWGGLSGDGGKGEGPAMEWGDELFLNIDDDTNVKYTRMRLLMLQGEWMEAEGLHLGMEGDKHRGGGGEAELVGRSHNQCLRESMKSHKEAARIGEDLVTSAARFGPHDAKRMRNAAGDAMLRLAKMCEEMLSERNDIPEAREASGGSRSGGGGVDFSHESLGSLSVRYYMRALAAGSSDARDRFPRVLFLLGDIPETREEFVAEARAVTDWAFLRWAPQMLALLARPEGSAVAEVLERVVKAFPRALFYPLLITTSSDQGLRAPQRGNTTIAVSARTEKTAAKLMHLAADPSAECFVEALRGLHHPELRFLDGMKRVAALVFKKDLSQAKKTYVKVREDCLLTQRPKIGSKIGQYNREFAKKRLAALDKSLKPDGSGLDVERVRKLIEEATGWKARTQTKSVVQLTHFSGWLADFDPALHSLEVPGQYGGLSNGPPGVWRHSRVVSFGSELLVMKSMRLPKRLIIHADDERDHLFLVKGGEDLRLDERVEQVFDVMNSILSRSASCARSRLFNRTYKASSTRGIVVPMTTDIGVIEWVQNTRPLKGVVEGCLGVKDLNQLKACQWIGDFSKERYHKMFKESDRQQVETTFQACVDMVPGDALRRHLMAMAPGPEAFITVRGGFARSLATLSMCSYVLGIGDRHLDNFLLDTGSGTVVGIDFGAAFGFGTSELPVPELIPFRLTNQFQHLLEPLDSVGLLKGHMVSTMQALRGGRETILSTMDVFLNEPIIDWLEGVANRQGGKEIKHKSEERDDLEGVEGQEKLLQASPEARRKINSARRKLEGENPASILIDDLDQNVTVKQLGSMRKLRGVAWGDSDSRVRFRSEKGRRSGFLPVPLQVDCLIDLATDPNVLGRQWVGLATWV